MTKQRSKFEDRGFLGPNEYKKTEKQPSHRGKITLSSELLQSLNDKYEAGDDVEIELSGWRKDDNPRMLSLKISIPMTKEEKEERYNDERVDYRAEKRRSSRPSRSARNDEHDESWEKPRASSRDQRDDTDDFPGDAGRRKRTVRNDEAGDESDL